MAETNFDKLLGQNGELVEERKKQVLAGALEIVQRYCEETPNKMEVVAALFGKKLGEEFMAEYIGRKDIIDTARFTVDGFETKNAFGNWVEEPVMLMWLLNGKAVIVDD